MSRSLRCCHGSGENKTWWGFYVTDYEMDGTRRRVIDRYSNDDRYYGTRGSSVTVKTDNGCTKVGTGASGIYLWEPADKWKGDFARDYMYMATAYQTRPKSRLIIF